MLGPLTLSLFIVTRTVAVVDLSSPKAPAIADALRKSMKGVAMAANRTNAAVSDAESLGLICSVDDDPCLEKLLVLIRADEMLAFAAGGASLSVVHLGKGVHQRGHIKVGTTPAATATAALAALDDTKAADPPQKDPPPKDPPPKDPPPKDPPPKDPPPKDPPPKDPPPKDPPPKDPPPGAAQTVSPAATVALVGGVVAVGVGVAAWGVSADLANKLLATKQGVPLPDNYYAEQTVMYALFGGAGVAAVVGVGAGVFAAVE